MDGLFCSTSLSSAPVTRIPTGIPMWDYMFGYSPSPTPDNPNRVVYGAPTGKLSMIAGMQGTGKTRVMTQWMSKMASTKIPGFRDFGCRILYVTGELSPQDFSREKLRGKAKAHRNFMIAQMKNLKTLEDHIRKVQPHFLVIDSINMLPEYYNGRGAELIVQGGVDTRNKQSTYNHVGLRSLMEKYQGHAILLTQLNKDGTEKGSTDFAHQVDICWTIHKKNPKTRKDVTDLSNHDPNVITLSIPQKHRYGQTGQRMFIKHHSDGISVCSNDYRKDKLWQSNTYMRRKRGSTSDNKSKVENVNDEVYGLSSGYAFDPASKRPPIFEEKQVNTTASAEQQTYTNRAMGIINAPMHNPDEESRRKYFEEKAKLGQDPNFMKNHRLQVDPDRDSVTIEVPVNEYGQVLFDRKLGIAGWLYKILIDYRA